MVKKAEVSESKMAVAKKHADKIREYAAEIVQGMVLTAGKYKALCLYIRENKVEKSIVMSSLTDMGFVKPMASKIFRVASMPKEQWDSYYASELGFNRALLLTRGTVERINEVIDVESTEIADAADEMQRVRVKNEEAPGKEGSPPDGETEAQKSRRLLLEFATKMMAIASKYNVFDKEWRSKDKRWKVSLTHIKKPGPQADRKDPSNTNPLDK